MAEEQRKAELSAELARARSRIGANLGALRRDLDFPARAKAAILKHPVGWLGGAALAGVLLTALPGRRKQPLIARRGTTTQAAAAAGKAGLLLTGLKIAYDLARPTLMKWAAGRVRDYMDSRRQGARFSK